MSKFNELVAKLREIFQIDRPELDFGIYRILNARSEQINHYLENRLAAKVKAALSDGNAATAQQLQSELQEAEKSAQALGVSPDAVPRVLELREKLARYGAGASEQENAVFSHLLAFFSRYYDNGDFISQRRYKGDTYAIPYAGEEVMLHWANKDQYYTKSGENFANYSFKLEDGRSVHCRLVAADTAKDNRKDNDKERRFVLIDPQVVTRVDEQGDDYEEELLPVVEAESQQGQELILHFEYRAMPKGSKQAALVEQAVERILADAAVKSRWLELGKRVPTEKNPQRTLLEKHLVDYTTKNTADYFIHKDLGGFLRRELDFYIKNEVMNLDDVQNASAFADIEKNLRMIQCLRAIALELIEFLAQLENFQKKLWLKKKFVVSSHYCITLDRIFAIGEDIHDGEEKSKAIANREKLIEGILANERQWKQWKQLGICDRALPGSIDDLKADLYRMVDTSLFSDEFKSKLLQLVPDVDAMTDGLLVHGDNFQALTILNAKHRSSIKSIYIDPPYNTDSSEIAYKNGYRCSSWIGLLADRVHASKSFLTSDGVLCATIDDAQQKELALLLDLEFGRENFLGSVSVRINPSGRVTLRGFAQCHEYGIFYGASQSSAIAKLARSDDQLARFNQIDSAGVFEWRNFRREGSASERYSRPKRFFPIYVRDGGYRVPNLKWNDAITAYEVLDKPDAGELVMYPIDSQGTERVWRWGLERISKEASEIVPKVNQRGDLQIYYKYRPNEEGVLPQTIWSDKKYSATEYGTALLKSLFSARNEFSFPKAIGAVEDSVRIMLGADQAGVVLDYFAGSGTTGHAVINLNREDGGRRKYILVEQGEYFSSVTKPRIQKCAYSADWKIGKPTTPESGISHCFKVLKLESYEDTLNNLQLRSTAAQDDLFATLPEQAQDDYLLRYMLDVESRGSLLSVEDFRKPFDYEMNIAVDSAGAHERRKVDLVETFNYLIGLRVRHIDAQPERGFVTVTGTLPSGESCLVLWRDCDKLDYEGVSKLCDRLAINPADNEFDVVYINGDHNIPTVLTQTAEEGGATRVLKLRQIEPEFLERMFSVEDV